MVHYKGSINKSVVGIGGPHGAGHLPGVCSSREVLIISPEGCRKKHLWNLEKGSCHERVVTSSEGHSLVEGPLREQG